MARVKGAMMTRKRRNKTLKLAKGYYGSKSRLFKTAKEAVMKSGQYAYIGRKQKKRDFRQLWITRISAACKMNGMNYSTFINGLKKAGIDLNRKMLSEIAISDPAAFTTLTEKLKKRLNKLLPRLRVSLRRVFLLITALRFCFKSRAFGTFCTRFQRRAI